MEPRVWIFLAGSLGGLVRAGLALLKKSNEPGFKFVWKAFAVTMIESFVAGAMMSAGQVHWAAAFIASAGLGSLLDKLGLQFNIKQG